MDGFALLNGIYFLMVPGLGIIFHSFIQYYSWKQRKQLTAFYFLCATKSLAGLIFCSVFVLWAAPVCLIGREFIWTNLVIEKILHGSLHIAISYLHLEQFVATLNRLIAVFSFSLYQKIFTMRNVKIYSIVAILPSSWMLSYYFWDVHAYFDDYYLLWEITSQASISPTDLESYFIWILMGTSCSIDIIAFFKILYDTHVNKAISGLEAHRRLALNKRILIQTVIEEMMFVGDNLVYQTFGTGPEERWKQFFGSTLTWCLSYTLEGLIIILFTADMRRRFFRQGKTTVTAVEGRPQNSHYNIGSSNKSHS